MRYVYSVLNYLFWASVYIDIQILAKKRRETQMRKKNMVKILKNDSATHDFACYLKLNCQAFNLHQF